MIIYLITGASRIERSKKGNALIKADIWGMCTLVHSPDDKASICVNGVSEHKFFDEHPTYESLVSLVPNLELPVDYCPRTFEPQLVSGRFDLSYVRKAAFERNKKKFFDALTDMSYLSGPSSYVIENFVAALNYLVSELSYESRFPSVTFKEKSLYSRKFGIFPNYSANEDADIEAVCRTLVAYNIKHCIEEKTQYTKKHICINDPIKLANMLAHAYSFDISKFQNACYKPRVNDFPYEYIREFVREALPTASIKKIVKVVDLDKSGCCGCMPPIKLDWLFTGAKRALKKVTHGAIKIHPNKPIKDAQSKSAKRTLDTIGSPEHIEGLDKRLNSNLTSKRPRHYFKPRG
jgi:hypothetical protein